MPPQNGEPAMSLFVDLRHLQSSVTNLSDVVDKMSTSIGRGKEDASGRCDAAFGFKPSLGVRFSQSQEDVYRSMPTSSRLKSHLSLPNLGKEDSVYDKVGFSREARRDSKPKIVEIEEERNDSNITIDADKIGDWVAASARKRPSFDDSGDTHPIDFLEELAEYAAELKLSPERRLPLALSCLAGVPLMWARCFRRELTTFDEFERAFREEFWSPERQKAVLYDLKLGKHDAGAVGMAEYFLLKVSSCRHLDPPPSDLEIVYSLAAHFPPAVELEMRLSQRPSLREAYRLLRRRDGQAADFVPNYLFDMCESFQRARKPDSARRTERAHGESKPSTSATNQH